MVSVLSKLLDELVLVLLGVTLDVLDVFVLFDKFDEDDDVWTAGGVVEPDNPVVVLVVGGIVFGKFDRLVWLVSVDGSAFDVDIFCKLRGICKNNSINLDS